MERLKENGMANHNGVLIDDGVYKRLLLCIVHGLARTSQTGKKGLGWFGFG